MAERGLKVAVTPIPGGAQRGTFVKNIIRANHSLGSQREVVPRLWGVCHPPSAMADGPAWGREKRLFLGPVSVCG